MNPWTHKSFTLYDDFQYLDRLASIYPLQENEVRTIEPELKEKLRVAFHNRDNNTLFNLLLKQKKFPIKDSYKAFFTRVPKGEVEKIIQNNPETVERIVNRIYALGFDKMIEGLEEPIETNRQIGPMFPNWIRKQYTSYANEIEFLNANDPISVLIGSDDALVQFVKKHLHVVLPTGSDNGEKGLDMVVKINSKPTATFVIGEAKFLTDEGGHQNAQLKDALDLITSSSFRNEGPYQIFRVAVLDGVCWINSKNSKMQANLRGLKRDQIAMSALLLDEFFHSLL